jgi:uncharacterized protein YegL/Tfp pilus assembly protein PilX
MNRFKISNDDIGGIAKSIRSGGIRAGVDRFRREEDGSLLIFGLFCFVIMLLMAGVAIDLMRFEERRTTLQNTVDRAVLAAADLNQTLQPKDVVKDYFRKAGLQPPADSDIIVKQGTFNEWRTVEAKVSEEMPTWFMNMMGVPVLGTPANGAAEERIGQVEISLVLDVSGSMNSDSRLTNLKPAAKKFVDTMFDTVEAGKISMSIITYSTQVSLGPDLMSYFNVTNEHNSSYCLEFDRNDYKQTAMKFGKSVGSYVYQRNGHFDPFYRSSYPYLLNCQTETNRYIMPFSGDRNALKAKINSLTADGNTSIDIGMKWGAALLDPSMSGVVTDMIAKNKIPAEFSERPYSYNDREALKVIVVMTDGANTTEYRLTDPYDHGNSILTGNTSYSPTDISQYSLYDKNRNQYYIMAKGMWRDQPWGDGTYDTCNRWGCTTYNDPGDSYPMTWPEVWERMSINYLADYIIRRAWGDTERFKWRAGGGETSTDIYSDKDDRTEDMCKAAKSKGVTIFAIGFEAPTLGTRLLKKCASSDAHYYDAAGTQISDVFTSIASSINKLRLTH